MRRQAFKQWLREHYGHGDHRYKDLLTDAESDKGYPWHGEYEEQRLYLIIRNACSECLETLRDAYYDYLMEEEP